jgi:mono/diheme cytochrome c family protein
VKSKVGLAAVPLVAGLLAWSGQALADGALTNSPEVGLNKGPRNWYLLRCSTCHGRSGEGTKHDYPQTGPALKGNPFVQNAPPAAIVQVIRKGRSGRQRLYHDTYPNMPSFGIEAVPDVDALVAYLKGDLQQ